MEEKNRNEIHNHYESGANCQVFNGDVTNCVFAMPGSTVTQQAAPPQASPNADRLTRTSVCPADDKARDEELLHFIHPSVDSTQEWQVHDEVKRLVARQGIQEICQYLLQMRKDNKVLLPQSPSAAYEELVRMGMPKGEGFNENTFRKYYTHK